MLDRLRAHLEDAQLIPPGGRVLVGYSGGADSTCLLHLLARLEVDVVAAHLHHGQRPEAETELKLCAAFAEELGVPFVSGHADVPRIASDHGIGLEEAGRQARYGFFDQAAFRLECDRIATAHTRSDLVETVVMNLARGAGLAGLAGVPERRGNLVRPLLPFSREETRAYCAEHGLWTHDDPANADVVFSRARVRHRVLPELRELNPAADAAIARLAETVRAEDDFLNGMAAAALERSERPLNGALAFLTEDVEVAFDRSTLLHLPPVLLRRALRLAVGALGGALDHHQTHLLSEGLGSLEKGSVTAEGGEIAVSWDAGQVYVRNVLPTSPFRYSLTVPGETESEEFGWRFVAYEEAPNGRRATREGMEALLDPERVKGQLYFQTLREGDSIQPFGFSGTRKLSDVLAEAGLTEAARRRLPIVWDMVGPVWAPGICLSDRAALRPESARCLIVAFQRLGSA